MALVPNRSAVLAARQVVVDYLVELRKAPRAPAGTTKILPSNDSFFSDAPITFKVAVLIKPTLLPGSNVVGWPFVRYDRTEKAWLALQAYLPPTHITTRGFVFAKNDTNIDLAISRTEALLDAVDEELAKEGVAVPTSRAWIYVAGLALVGAVAFATRKKTGRKARRRRR